MEIIRHRNTILAALRFWQQYPPLADERFNGIATDGGTTPLTEHEIDALCERINGGTALWVYVRVYLKAGDSPEPAFDYTMIQADTEEDAYTLGGREPLSDERMKADGYGPANDYVVPCGPLVGPAYVEEHEEAIRRYREALEAHNAYGTNGGFCSCPRQNHDDPDEDHSTACRMAREVLREIEPMDRPETEAQFGPDTACLILVRGGGAEVIPGAAVYDAVIDFDNIGAGDPPPELPRGKGFEALIGQLPDLEEGKDYTWEKEEG